MINNNITTERLRFQEWILNNWKPKYHNFSLKEDGKYYFDSMEDAWTLWLAAKNDFIDQMEEKDGNIPN